MNKEEKLLYHALNESELYEFLIGQKNYEIVNKYSDTPTDPNKVFDLIKNYYAATRDFTVWNDFNMAFLRVIENPKYTWFSLYYFINILRDKDEDIFIEKHIDIDSIKYAIEKNLKAFKNLLMNNKNWIGKDFENGLWGDILRLQKNFSNYNHFKMDLEENENLI